MGTDAKIIIKSKRTRIKISKQVKDALTLVEESFSDATEYFGTTLDLDLVPLVAAPSFFLFLQDEDM